MVISCLHLVSACRVNVMIILRIVIQSLGNVEYVSIHSEIKTHLHIGRYRIVRITQQGLIVSSACPVMSMSRLGQHLPVKHAVVHRLVAGKQLVIQWHWHSQAFIISQKL